MMESSTQPPKLAEDWSVHHAIFIGKKIENDPQMGIEWVLYKDFDKPDGFRTTDYKMQCIYCKGTFGGFNISKLKLHFSGRSTDVKKCNGPSRHGRSDAEYNKVKEEFLEVKRHCKAPKSNNKQDVTPISDALSNQRIQANFKMQSEEALQIAFARGMYATGMAANVVNNPWMQDFFRQMNFRAPSAFRVLGKLLENEKNRVETQIANCNRSTEQFGFCLVGDGASNIHREPILNVLSVQGTRVEFLEARNVQGNTKDGKFIAKLFIDKIQKIGPRKLWRSYKTTQQEALGKLLRRSFRTSWRPLACLMFLTFS